MTMKNTISTNLMTGDYSALIEAHLKHDEDKYNSNEDIRFDKRHLNTSKVHVANFDDFYEEKYEGPIKEYNAKQKRKDRKLKDYKEHLEKKRNNKNRNKDRPHDPNRLMLMNFSDAKTNKQLKREIMVMLGITEDEYLALMASAMDLSVERFNERYKDHMKITRHHTHVNEASPHVHADLWAYGKDRYGKPYTDINEALQDMYKGTKVRKDGKVLPKRITDQWSEFRHEVDTLVFDAVKDTLVKELKEKSPESSLDIEFYRKESDIVGLSGEVYKEVHRQADDMLDKKKRDLGMREVGVKLEEDDLAKRRERVSESEEKVESRKRTLDSVSAEFKERSSKKWDEFESWEERLKAKEVQLETMEARINQYVRESMDKAKDDTLVGRAWRRTAQKDPKRMASYNRVLKAEKEYAMGRNLRKTGREGFDLGR